MKNPKLNSLSVVVFFALIILFQFCKPAQQASTATSAPIVASITYEKDIRPIMLNSCTPCHFPEQGKKKMLDTYAATRDNINDIIQRVQLPTTEEKYMPFRSKKPALTADQVKLLKDWVKQGMAN